MYERPEEIPKVAITACVADNNSSMGEFFYLSTSVISYSSYETSGSYGDIEEED
jgi:hypothetical protein